MSSPSEHPHTEGLSTRGRIDVACDAFEREWIAGQRPRIEDHLRDGQPAERGQLLRDLLEVDLEYRRAQGETPTPADYQSRFPDDVALIVEVFRAESDTQVSAAEESVPRDKFLERVTNSGLLAADDLQALQNREAADDTTLQLAADLVAAGGLTSFQAEVLCRLQPIPLILGNYVITDRIGAGGMGEVYKAHHRRMERTVALKILPAAVTQDKAAIQRFHREIKAAARLEHPHIVTAYDADEANGVHFLVMQYVEGADLSSVVKQGGTLPVEAGINCILQAARGLEYAHGQHVIHRDIKPSNLLLSSKGTVKVLDMGLARFEEMADDVTQQELTGSSTIMGTVDFMSPEQAVDTKHADARSDIYSLGCTLFYLLTGHRMYRGENMIQTVLSHREEQIPSLMNQVLQQSESAQRDAAARPAVPLLMELDAIYQKMVAKQPDDRYQTMGDVITALEGIMQPVGATGSGTLLADHALQQFLSGPPEAVAATITEPPRKDVAQNETIESGYTDDTFSSGGRSVVGSQRPKSRLPGGILIGAGLLAVVVFAVLAGIFLIVDTPAGTIILEIDQPEVAGAVVSVDGEKKITIKTGEGTEPIEVTADEKTHTLKVTKGGFEAFVKEFTVKAGKQQTIRVRLVPVAVVGNDGNGKKADGPSNYAMRFVPGTGSRVHFPVDYLDEDSAPDELTIELRCLVNSFGPPNSSFIQVGSLKLATYAKHQTIVGWWNGGGKPLYLGKPHGVAIHKNEPLNLAVQWKNKKVTFFVNGRPGPPVDFTPPVVLAPPQLPAGLLGTSTSAPTVIFDGLIDELRISKGARYDKAYTPQVRFERDKDTLALYHFDEGWGGVATDFSGNARHAKVIDAQWVKTDERLQVMKDLEPEENYALEFDGKSSYVETPVKYDGSHAITIEASAVVFDEPPWGILVGYGGNFSIKKTTEERLETNVLTSRNGNFQKHTVDSISRLDSQDGKRRRRVHVAAVLSRNHLKLFLDGELQDDPLAIPKGFVRQTHPFFIGAAYYGKGKQVGSIAGIIDEVRISNVARYTKDFTPAKRFTTDKNTLALYHFDSGTGDVLKDSSGNGHHGKIVGAKWVKVDDELKVIERVPDENFALEFDGNRGHVDAPTLNYDGSQPITLEALIRPESLAWSALMSDTPISLAMHNPGLGNSWRIGGAIAKGISFHLDVEGRIENGRPIHLAAVYDMHSFQLYVNGRTQPAALTRFAQGKNRPTNGPVRMTDVYPKQHFRISDENIPFHGVIDEVRISNIARYTKDFTPAKRFEKDEHTLALYHFDEGSGDVLKDSSGNNHHGKIVGAKWVKVDDELKVVGPKRAFAWKPGPAEEILPGLVPRPATIPGVHRWNVQRQMPVEQGAVDWSPDGKLIARGTSAQQIHVYDAKSLSLRQTFGGHAGLIARVAWSPDGERLASASLDKTVRVWHRDGTLECVLRGQNKISDVCWAPDGKHLAATDTYVNLVRIWSVDGKEVMVLKGHSSYVFHVAWSPDGKLLASAGFGGAIHFWHATTGESAGVLGAFSEPARIHAIAWSADGSRLSVAGTRDTQTCHAQIWNVQERKRIDSFTASGSWVTWMSWHPLDEARLGFVTNDGYVKVFQLSPLERAGSPQYVPIRDASWSPDGRQIVDSFLRVFNVPEQQPEQINRFAKPIDIISVSQHPESGELQLGGYHGDVIEVSMDGRIAQVKQSQKKARSAWSLDGKRLAISDGKGLEVWSEGSEKPDFRFEPADGAKDPTWSPDGSLIAVGGYSGPFYLVNLDGSLAATLEGHTGDTRRASWHPRGTWLATGAVDRTVRLWKPDGTAGPVLNAGPSINDVSWSPDGKWVAGVGYDKKVRLWSESGAEGTVLDGHARPINSVCWNPAGDLIVSGDLGGNVVCWKRSAALNQQGPDSVMWTATTGRRIEGMVWSLDGKQVIAATADDRLCYLNAESGAIEKVLCVLPNAESACFSTAGKPLRLSAAAKPHLAWIVQRDADGKLDVLDYNGFQALIDQKDVQSGVANPDRKAAEWVLGIGGKVTVQVEREDSIYVTNTEALPEKDFAVIEIDLSGIEECDDDGLKNCRNLKDIEKLMIDGTGVTDDGMFHLIGLKSLLELGVHYTSVSNRGLETLTALSQLEELSLSASKITGEGLRHLSAFPALRMIGLDNTAITGADYSQLQHCQQLRGLQHFRLKEAPAALKALAGHKLGSLNIRGSDITNRDVKLLKGITQLKRLGISKTAISDDGLPELLDACKSLTNLNLQDTNITDHGLESLAKLVSLKEIILTGTKVTAQGINVLKKALPNCNIVWEPLKPDDPVDASTPRKPNSPGGQQPGDQR